MKKLIHKIKENDRKVSFSFLKFYHHYLFNDIMKFISSCGDFGMSWLVVILITNLISQTRQMSIQMLIALIAATLVGQVTIKSIVKRKRPCHVYPNVDMLIAIPNDYSFPSGHTTSSFACSTVMMMYFPLLGIVGYVYATLTAFSRLYLFVHYLSDVLFGMALGILIGWLVVIL